MISVDVFDEIETERFNQTDYLALLGLSIFDMFDGFLDYSATVAVLGELDDILFNDEEESFFVDFLSFLKDLLEDVVAELVFG